MISSIMGKLMGPSNYITNPPKPNYEIPKESFGISWTNKFGYKLVTRISKPKGEIKGIVFNFPGLGNHSWNDDEIMPKIIAANDKKLLWYSLDY